MRRNILTQQFVIGLYILLWCIMGCSQDDSDRDTSAKKQAESNYCFLVAERNQISRISLTGEKEKFYYPTGKIECCGDTLYLSRRGNLTALDLKGNYVSKIKRADEIEYQINFTAIPQGGFAFLDNKSDKVYFTDAEGNYSKTVDIKDSSDNRLQNMHGIVVGNRLILSENGDRQIVSIDLTSHKKTLFSDFSKLGSLSAIAYHGGTYYVCQRHKVFSFTEEADEPQLIAEVPVANLTGIKIVVDKAYAIANGVGQWKRTGSAAGVLYQIDLTTGDVKVIKDGLLLPDDLAIIPET